VIGLKSLAKIAALSVATTFALTQPAKAVLINTFEFTDLDGDGTGRVPGEKVTGTITFDSLNPGDTATGVPADSVVVDSIPSWLDSTWGDATDMKVGINLVQFINLNNVGSYVTEENSFKINSGVISTSGGSFGSAINLEEFSLLNNTNKSIIADDSSYGWDELNSTLTFSDGSASVPFEFSPTLGLLLMGGVFGISRYAKSRKAIKLIDN
jgi:hypothetical protein